MNKKNIAEQPVVDVEAPTLEYYYPFIDYQQDVLSTLGPDGDPLLLALGVGGEAGEVLEIMKKGHRPGKEVDVTHLKEELGDVLWYIAALAATYGLDLEEIAQENIAKLKKRYGR